LGAAVGALHGDDLHGDVADFGEEAVENGAADEDFPSGACGLTEDDVGDGFLLGEADECVGDVAVSECDDGCAEVACHALDVLEPLVGFRVAVSCVGLGFGDVDGVPVGGEAAGDACADADEAFVAGAVGEADHDFFGDGGLLEALVAAVLRGARANLLRSDAEAELAEHVEVAFAEEVGEGLLNFFRGVDFSLAETGAEFFDGDVDVDDLVGAFDEAVGDGFADGGVCRAGDGVVEGFQMLDVDGSHDVDAGLEELEDIFVAFAVFAAGDVCVGELVDDDHLGSAGDDRVHVHFLELDGAVGDDAERDLFEVADLGFGVFSAVGFDESDDEVSALVAEEMGVVEHVECFSDAGCGADVDAELSGFGLTLEGEFSHVSPPPLRVC